VHELTLATGNRHKTEEIQVLLGQEWIIRDLRSHPGLRAADETGGTFEENARLKAVAISRAVPGLVLADDSGLEVDALDGEPGVRSARFAGESASDDENVALLLDRLRLAGARGKQRSARFRCVLALARDGAVVAIAAGTVEGIIANEPKGNAGFGYDPVFIPEGYCATFAELGPAVKARESHRARAILRLQDQLQKLLKAG
jgi:XTP/dITP diphosphohydrolase